MEKLRGQRIQHRDTQSHGKRRQERVSVPLRSDKQRGNGIFECSDPDSQAEAQNLQPSRKCNGKRGEYRDVHRDSFRRAESAMAVSHECQRHMEELYGQRIQHRNTQGHGKHRQERISVPLRSDKQRGNGIFKYGDPDSQSQAQNLEATCRCDSKRREYCNVQRNSQRCAELSVAVSVQCQWHMEECGGQRI